MCENHIRGTHTGALVTPDVTLPPSGRLFDRPYAAVFEIEGERIRRQSLHFDRAQVMLDLGPADATARNIEVVKGIYAAFGTRDMQFILDHVADDVSWGIESVAKEVAPYGLRTGKDGVAGFFAAWGETADFHTFEASGYVAAGDHVFNTLSYDLTVKATGKHLRNAGCSQHWTLKNGKVVRWRGWEDTAATRDAFRK
jgi:ketosteroid isomerase-like protein